MSVMNTETNAWGTPISDVGEGFCPDCEREGWGTLHYDNCPQHPKSTWITLTDPTEIADYHDGTMSPLASRGTAAGIEVWMPHTFRTSPGWSGANVCLNCGLLPMDYDKVEIPCPHNLG